MATPAVEAPADVVQRNLGLTDKIMRFLLDNPHVFRSLPDSFELVILPDDDPAIRSYNLELLDRYGSEGKPIVFARMTAHSDDPAKPPVPSIFVPIPVAA
jgi:Family of unknown function (DUF5647)